MTAKISIEEIERFDAEKLSHVSVQEKAVVPSVNDIYSEMLPDDLSSKKELEELKKFAINNLKKVETVEKAVLPDKETIEQEKVLSRAEVTNFEKSKLKHVETKVADSIPTPQQLRGELMPDCLPNRPELLKLQGFVISYLKHVDTIEKNALPTKEDMSLEAANTLSEVTKFNTGKLKHVESVEKNTLPDLTTLWEELLPDEIPSKPEIEQLKKFAKTDLRHVEPNVKFSLPTPSIMRQEEIETRADITKFDKSNLKKVECVEKNPLPTIGDIFAEQIPDYIPSKPEIKALNSFVKSALKHIDTLEKIYLPTSADIIEEKKAASTS